MQALLLGLKALVGAGNSYEDLKNLTMQICYTVVPPMDPDLLCEGASYTLGPHVITGGFTFYDYCISIQTGRLHYEQHAKDCARHLSPVQQLLP